jgi:DNA ligase-1
VNKNHEFREKKMIDVSRRRYAAHLAWLAVSVYGAAPARASSAAAAAPVPANVPPALMLGKNWQSGLDPSAFLVSEKFDGVRALWDGRRLLFRSGRPIAAPGWFTQALPATPLDGELWLGRGQFDRGSGIVRRSMAVDAEWRELRYMVFDLPGQSAPFAERVLQMAATVQAAGLAWLQAVPQTRISSLLELQKQLRQLTRDGAEGLVLHRQDALWVPGRSDALRKLKTVPDEDGQVVGVQAGQGRHAGRMGALLLEMANGQRFALGTGFSDALRQAPPPVGAWVTYRYRGRTPSGLPRFASFLRLAEAP